MVRWKIIKWLIVIFIAGGIIFLIIHFFSKPPTHKVCKWKKCVEVPGKGENLCETDADCPLPIGPERCKYIKDPAEKEKCINEMNYLKATIDRDVEKCISLLPEGEKRDECVYIVARSEKNEKYCEKISSEEKKEKCFIHVAMDKLDEKICDFYFKEEPFERRECKDKVKSERIIRNKRPIEECKEVKTLEYGTICFETRLKQIGGDCNKIKDKELRDWCKSIKIKETAKTKKDCLKIPLEDYRKVCIKMIETGKSDFELDSDNDGKNDGGELFYRIDPFDPDTDDDGLLDGDEIYLYSTNPKDPDTDEDGLSDFEEIMIFKSDPHRPDTDNDGISDFEEVKGKKIEK